MPAISILYAPSDEAFGRRIAEATARSGHEPHLESKRPDIGDLMQANDVAIVLWSRASRDSSELIEQARNARTRGLLIPISVGGAEAPNEFGHLQPVDLSGWAGDENDPRWRFVLDEIALCERRQILKDTNVWAQADRDESHAETDAGLEAAPFAPVRARRPRSKKTTFNPARVIVIGGLSLATATLAAVFIAPAALIRLQAPSDVAGLDDGADPSEIVDLAVLQPAAAGDGDSTEGGNATPEPDFELTVRRDENDAYPSLDNVANSGAGEADLSLIEFVDEFEGETNGTPELAPVAENSGDAETPPADEIGDLAEGLTAASDGNGAENGSSQGLDDLIETALAETNGEAPDAEAMERLVASVSAGVAELSIADGAGVPAAGRAPTSGTFRDCANCPEMAVAPAGSFRMGSPAGEQARHDAEGPLVTIALNRTFAIGVREVTFAEWDACVADGGCRGYRPPDQGWGRGDAPAINVSFADAEAYATWLTQKTGQPYRLPSEAEWEYSARAGTQSPFSFGAGISTDRANYNGQYRYGGPAGEFRRRTVATGSFAPNEFGLYDMHGNVWEWTADCWAPSHANAAADGSARSGNCNSRVLKGGAWNTGAWRLRSAHRIGKSAVAREYDNGFRVVRELN